MTTTTNCHMTLEEYLNYDDGTDTRYELVNGELIEVPSESDLNNLIAIYLLAELLRFFPVQLLRRGTEIVVTGYQTTTRIPDLMVLTEELASALAGTQRSIIMPSMPPPVLVVEIVSPGTVNEERDYRYKRSEYAARGIAEYWIVDPQQVKVTILTLVAGLYEEAVFSDDSCLISYAVPNLELTAAQVLQIGEPIKD
ncbi:MAG: Uma2 family endonuclease [Leptolyngbyaceae cyanobacterium SL_5_9]|nr:Uma2 family endonuclease [Leptolyngbyaceae cyanobacterium SL_5_9]NJO73580.1 Uma2 family endonuclease [Leptolyngbyaceae cyanobacterium RM1_406_9]